MKKLFYVTCLFLITALSSFSTKSNHSSFTKFSAKRFSCPAAQNLTATKNYTSITLGWESTASVSSFSPGGYYNWIDQNGAAQTTSFGGPTNTNVYYLTVPLSTYRLTYQVTTTCTDNTTSTSSSATFNF